MSRRGFTLMELTVVVSIGSIVAGALGAFYLEARVGGARVEATLALEREASLVTEWVRRDLRGASAVRTVDDGVVLDQAVGAPVRYVAREGHLVRDDGEPHVLGRDVVGLAMTPGPGREVQVTLALERALGARSVARAERSFVAVRLP